MRKLLLVPILIIGAILTLPLVIWQQLRMGPLRKYRKRHRKPPRPVTEESLGKSEKLLGFEFPADLRSFYLDGRYRRSAPCGEFYSLKNAVKEYRMLTAKPYGPNGEDWPANLFPFEDLLHGYGAYDRDTGLITLWDPDEIAGGNESKAAWKRSFQPTGKTLAEYLAR